MSKRLKPDLLASANEVKAKRSAESVITNKELVLAKARAKLTEELIIINKQLTHQIEKRQQTELALEESNDKYLKAFQSSPYLIIITNMEDGKIIEVNDTFVLLSGFTRKEALSNSTIGFDMWKDKRVRNSVISALRSGKVVEGKEFEFRKKNGEIRTGLFSAKITHVNREPHIISSINDITDQKQARETLIASETRYRRLFESAQDGILILDEETGMVVDVNPFLVQLLGYSKEQFCDKLVWELGFFKDIVANHDKFIELQQNKYVRYDDLPLETKDGLARNVEFVSNVYISGQRKVIQCNIRDITERKRAEKLLRESEQKSLSIMENSADAIFITTQQGKYIYTNKAVSKLLGYTSEEMKSKTIADISLPDKIAESFQFFNQILNEGKGFTELELLKKDGNYISTDLNAVVLPDGTIYGSCRDISRRKKVESELIKSKEHAEESDRLKSAFLANMSHEIRTPMNGILGFAELLKEPGLTIDEQQKYIRIIEKSGARMLNIITDIVDISKIQSGMMEINLKEVKINQTIEDTYAFFTPEIEGKGIKFSFKNALPAKEAIIKTDSDKIFAILTNLVKNAIKFTEKGSIEIGYNLVETDNYPSLRFFVQDTGIGIAKDRQEAIFDRFIQADITDKMAKHGAGLGLSIAKAYVEMLGGKIWVESEPGVGSTFYFTISNID